MLIPFLTMWTLVSAHAAELDCALLSSPPAEIADALMARPADKRMLGVDILLEQECELGDRTRSLHVARRVLEMYADDADLHKRLVFALSGDREAQASALKPNLDPNAPLPPTTPSVRPEEVREIASAEPYLEHVATVHRCTMQSVSTDFWVDISLGHVDGWVLLVGSQPVSRGDFRRLLRHVEKGGRPYQPREGTWTTTSGMSSQNMQTLADAYNARLQAGFGLSASEARTLVLRHKPVLHDALQRRGCQPPASRTLLDR